ncbi:MAG: hypothetical protein KGS47_16170 [Chloroflexi bacterium]|nr:hypothetical protein [Chloroflexota bacterium]
MNAEEYRAWLRAARNFLTDGVRLDEIPEMITHLLDDPGHPWRRPDNATFRQFVTRGDEHGLGHDWSYLAKVCSMEPDVWQRVLEIDSAFEVALRRHVIDRDAAASRDVADAIAEYVEVRDGVEVDAEIVRLWLVAMPRVRAMRLYRERLADDTETVAPYADAYLVWHRREHADTEALVMLRDIIDGAIDDARRGGGVDWLAFDHALTEHEYWYGADVLQHWHVAARTLTEHTAIIDDADDDEEVSNA